MACGGRPPACQLVGLPTGASPARHTPGLQGWDAGGQRQPSECPGPSRGGFPRSRGADVERRTGWALGLPSPGSCGRGEEAGLELLCSCMRVK